MNSLFRNIKENKNLDHLEESDSEDDFENVNDDKYLKKVEYKMICYFNNTHKLWYPIKPTQDNVSPKKNDYCSWKIYLVIYIYMNVDNPNYRYPALATPIEQLIYEGHGGVQSGGNINVENHINPNINSNIEKYHTDKLILTPINLKINNQNQTGGGKGGSKLMEQWIKQIKRFNKNKRVTLTSCKITNKKIA